MIIRGRTPKPLSSGIGHDQWCQLARPPPGSRLLARETKTSWPRALAPSRARRSSRNNSSSNPSSSFFAVAWSLRKPVPRPRRGRGLTRAQRGSLRRVGSGRGLAIRFHRGCVCPGPRAPPWAQPRRRRGAAGRGVAGRSAVGPSPARLCCAVLPQGPCCRPGRAWPAVYTQYSPAQQCLALPEVVAARGPALELNQLNPPRPLAVCSVERPDIALGAHGGPWLGL